MYRVNKKYDSSSIMIITSLVFGIMLGAHCGGPSPEELAKMDQALIGKFQTELQGRLKNAIKTGGPVGAIETCHIASPELEKKLSSQGVLIRRVSDKPRNPAHQGDNFESGVLADWRTDIKNGKKPAPVQKVHEGKLRYMSPIMLGKGVCLMCHGPAKSLPPELKAKLKEKYPDDKALGYKLGELRGAFSTIRDAQK